MLPACLVRAAPGRWLLAPPGWALLGPGPGLCLKWRHQPPHRELALLLRAARRSIGTRAGGLRAEKPGDSSDKHVSLQRGRREETLLSAAQKGRTGRSHWGAGMLCAARRGWRGEGYCCSWGFYSPQTQELGKKKKKKKLRKQAVRFFSRRTVCSSWYLSAYVLHKQNRNCGFFPAAYWFSV